MPDGRKLLGRQSALHNAFLDAALFVETGFESALLGLALFDEMLFFAFVSWVRAGVKAKAPATIDATAVSSNLFMFQLPGNSLPTFLGTRTTRYPTIAILA